jgi:broad specificity phosphatase PhoE
MGPSKLPQLYLARHGETAWSLSGQHTGRTDIPLTARGEDNARRIGRRLAGLAFGRVWTSPLGRARRTAELAGFAAAEVDPDLAEWDYGDYEGRTSADVRGERPGWDLFRDGCPRGETAAQVGARVDRVLARVRAEPGDSLVFAHGHVLRVLAARWLGLPPDSARLFLLGTAAVCVLGYEHERADSPAVRLWNDDRHLA